MSSFRPRGVHLVGSVPLATVEEVFRGVASTLGRHVQRIPDGEVGERLDWVVWQAALFRDSPDFETTGPRETEYRTLPRFKLREGTDPAQIRLPPPGYAAAAKSSYAHFARLKSAGVIPAHCKFQVSLPTPIAPLRVFVEFFDNMAVEPIYEAKLLGELDELAAFIPHDELAIQWDISVEMAAWEAVYSPRSDWMEERIVDMLARIGERVPTQVELGYHLCYGDAAHAHWKEPKDTAHLVEVANRVSVAVKRPIQWIHMPVPRERSDAEYFAPLDGLALHPETELFLGLVHLSGGREGCERRIEAASQVVPKFGIATECGFGRRPVETISPLLHLHAELADSIV